MRRTAPRIWKCTRTLAGVLVLVSLVGCGRGKLIGGRPRSYWMKECTRVSLLTFWNSDKDERRHLAFAERNKVPSSGDALNALAALGPKAAAAAPEFAVLLVDD